MLQRSHGGPKTMHRLILCALTLVLAHPLFAQSPAPSAVALGSEADAHWTDTTNQAAATPENKTWLGRGKTVSVTGEVVDVSCYLQLGKRGPKHVDCGRKCVQAGQPGGLLDKEGNLYLLVPE